MPAYPQKKKKNLIKYKDAPSGYINIEKWVPPFIPVSKGFGYMGVLAQDSKSGKLQCHKCGEWYEQLPTHIQKHNLNANSYREQFGLLTSTALKSQRIRLIHSQVMIDFRKTGKKKFLRKFKKNNKESANRKGKPKALESQNQYGNCDLQIINKIIKLGEELGKTPTLIDIKKEFGGGMVSTMHSRYGSYVKYCRKYLKLEPNRSRNNPWNKKQWKNYLLDIGRKSINKGNPLLIKKLLPINEQRYIYRYFKSFKNYKELLLESYENKNRKKLL